VDAQEAMRDHAAAEEGAKLLLDEARCRLLYARGAREESFELLPNNSMQEGLLRLMALIVGYEVPVRHRVGERSSRA